MNIREPQVHATYFYLRETPDDTAARRADRHATFEQDTHRLFDSLAAWLSMPAPDPPAIPAWDGAPPREMQPLIETSTLNGRTNATALLRAYALRNMLLLRVVVARPGDHEDSVWPMLDEALGSAATTPTWLHTTRYWCAVASRPPEELDESRLQPIRTEFGVLCLGEGATPHLLIYPDARTEARARAFLNGAAVALDWHNAQARYRLEVYEDYASKMARHQQQALDQLLRAGTMTQMPNRLRSLEPLGENLGALEAMYADALADLNTTRAAAQEIRALMAEYRATLMRNGLWDAAPTVWEARAAGLAAMQTQIDADAASIDATLRRMESMFRALQTRVTLAQSERERMLIYLIAGVGVALLTVLIADTSLTRMIVRLVALGIVAALVWSGWQYWLRSQD